MVLQEAKLMVGNNIVFDEVNSIIVDDILQVFGRTAQQRNRSMSSKY